MYETVGRIFHTSWVDFKSLDVREMIALEQKAVKVLLSKRLTNINDNASVNAGGNHLRAITMALKYNIKDIEEEGY